MQKAKEKEAREEAMRRRREEAKAREVRPRRPLADGAAIFLRPRQPPPRRHARCVAHARRRAGGDAAARVTGAPRHRGG